MLERMRRKGNPNTLLVGMQTGTATVENSMEFPQKTKNGTAFDPVIPLLGLCLKSPETPIQKNLCTPMFIAAQFTKAKCWKQPKCPSVNEWIKKTWYIYTMEYYTVERKKELLPSWHMDGTGEHYAKWNKSGGEGQIPYDLTFNWNIINKRKKQAKYNQSLYLYFLKQITKMAFSATSWVGNFKERVFLFDFWKWGI